MPQKEPNDYSSMYDFLYRIDRRIKYLEKDIILIEKQVVGLEGTRSKKFQLLSDELKELRAAASALKNNLSQCTQEMYTLSKDLKNVVKKEDIQILDSQVNDIKFEEYVTRNDLKRGV